MNQKYIFIFMAEYLISTSYINEVKQYVRSLLRTNIITILISMALM